MLHAACLLQDLAPVGLNVCVDKLPQPSLGSGEQSRTTVCKQGTPFLGLPGLLALGGLLGPASAVKALGLHWAPWLKWRLRKRGHCTGLARGLSSDFQTWRSPPLMEKGGPFRMPPPRPCCFFIRLILFLCLVHWDLKGEFICSCCRKNKR